MKRILLVFMIIFGAIIVSETFAHSNTTVEVADEVLPWDGRSDIYSISFELFY